MVHFLSTCQSIGEAVSLPGMNIWASESQLKVPSDVVIVLHLCVTRQPVGHSYWGSLQLKVTEELDTEINKILRKNWLMIRDASIDTQCHW